MPPPFPTSTFGASKVPRRFTRNDILFNINCLVRKACTTYQKQTLAVVFVLLETISIILDIFGTNTWEFSFALFLISVFGFVMTLYSAFVTEKGIWNRFIVVELVFSFTQLIIAYTDLVMKILHIKINCNYKASAFPLAFSIIVLVYAFKAKKKSTPTDFSVSSVPKWDGSPPTDPEWSGSPGKTQGMAVDSDFPGSSISIDENPKSDGFHGVSKDNTESHDSLKKRNTAHSSTKKVGDSYENFDDGYRWRKYGQRGILGAKHPRTYYKCESGRLQECLARKYVQKSDEDPTMLEVVYNGAHTCSTENNQTVPKVE